MLHLFQVGVGSGGMPVLDLVARDSRIGEVTIVEPDIYKEHNVVRHVFPASDIGARKADLAKRWLAGIRPELAVNVIPVDLCDPAYAKEIDAAAARCDLGICAADNEAAKHQFNHLMLKHDKPWTLGEVLSGGIGGFVHVFRPCGDKFPNLSANVQESNSHAEDGQARKLVPTDNACYGCVATFLKRGVTTEIAKPADYSQPTGTAETSIPASKASIAVIASLHAQVTLAMLDGDLDFTSLLFTLRTSPGIFEEAYRPYKFRVPRSAACLLCQLADTSDLDRRLDAALDRLNS